MSPTGIPIAHRLKAIQQERLANRVDVDVHSVDHSGLNLQKTFDLMTGNERETWIGQILRTLDEYPGNPERTIELKALFGRQTDIVGDPLLAVICLQDLRIDIFSQLPGTENYYIHLITIRCAEGPFVRLRDLIAGLKRFERWMTNRPLRFYSMAVKGN